jgi:tetratricopeptide (TPR) repeat protein
MDRDEVIDLLDDHLTTSSSGMPGLVEEVGPVNLTEPAGSNRHVWRYRFKSQLFRTAFVRFGLTSRERVELSRVLARSLERIYGTERPAVALRLAVLYRTAGDLGKANHYRRQAGSHMPPAVTMDQARALLDSPDMQAWDWAECRRATRILIDAAQLFSSLGALDEAVPALQLAAVLARRADMAADEADALMVLGATEAYTGAPEAARSHLESAAAIWRSIDRSDGEAESLKHLAWLDGLTGNRARALESLDRSLALLRKLGFHDRVLDLYLHNRTWRCDWTTWSSPKRP